jgi:hypothetical protein
LFRSLFRGREDVFPKRWDNTKTGKAGYAPACANEWAPRICGKTEGKMWRMPEPGFSSCHKLFAFLKRRDAEPTNNESERVLRH